MRKIINYLRYQTPVYTYYAFVIFLIGILSVRFTWFTVTSDYNSPILVFLRSSSANFFLALLLVQATVLGIATWVLLGRYFERSVGFLWVLLHIGVGSLVRLSRPFLEYINPRVIPPSERIIVFAFLSFLLYGPILAGAQHIYLKHRMKLSADELRMLPSLRWTTFWVVVLLQLTNGYIAFILFFGSVG